MDNILVLDLGTSNIKAILFNQNGTTLYKKSSPTKTYSPSPGYAEQNPEELTTSALALIEAINTKYGIDVISLSGAMHSIFPIDNKDKPLTNALIWSDMRSSADADELKPSDPGIELHKSTGTPIHPMSPLCKLLWFRKNQPQLWNQAKKFISLKEYLVFRLTGQYLVDSSMASSSGLLNLTSLEWSDLALNTTDTEPEKLSRLVSVKEQIPTNLSGLNHIPLVVGGADGCLANLGSGVLNSNRWTVTIGTSSAIRTTTSEPFIGEELHNFCYHLDDHYFVKGGASNNGGNVYEWLLKEHRFSPEDLAKSKPTDHKLVTLPYIFGERAPLWKTGLQAMTIGNSVQSDPVLIARSYLEGICFNLKLIARSLKAPDEILVSGGFTNSTYWVQMLADIFQIQVRTLKHGDTSAFGAFLVAIKSLGKLPAYENAIRSTEYSQTYQPEQQYGQLYQDRFNQFKELALSQ